MKKEINREHKCHLVHDQVVKVSRATKRKPATVTLAIPDDLAVRLIKNMMMSYFDANFHVVGMRLEWTNVNYIESVTPHPRDTDEMK